MRKKLLFALCLAAVIAPNIYFRTFLINFPQLRDIARKVVDQRIQQTAVQAVYKKFPQFDPLAKDRLIKSAVADLRRQNKAALKQQVNDIYLQLKDKYQDERGQTYLMELDCWHWSRYVENVVRLGHPGDQTVYGNQLDLYMLAPQGMYLHWDQFLFYFSAFLYKAFTPFKAIPLFTFLFYLPLFFASVFIVALYFFAFRYGRYICAVVACLFIGLSPIFLQRSCAGWFDKDILNLLFPLLVVWTYLAAVGKSDFLRKALLVCLSGFFLGLFCFTWTHWWFILFVIIIYEVFSFTYLVCLHFFRKRDVRSLVRDRAASVFLFAFFTAFWILLLAGRTPLVELYRQIRLALILNKPLMSSVWPNVYSTVGELRRLKIGEIAQSMGNVWLFSFSLISLIGLLVRSFLKETYAGLRRETLVMFVIWFVAMLFAATRGVRFLVFMLIPLGISLGWAMEEFFEYARSRKNVWIISLVVLAVMAVGYSSFSKANAAARNSYPLIDDSWYKVLTVVREKTPDKTILNSWWDFGDWFKVVARRRVIFDGQSQDTPQAYWMAKSILSTDEERAVAILRMLNNGGNRAFEIINRHVKEQLQAVLLLESILGVKPEDAQRILMEHLPVLAVEEVMRLLYYNPAPACFVAESSMVPKMPAISYLGDWDFSKVYIVQNFNVKERDKIVDYLRKLGRNPADVQRFYQEAFLISSNNLDVWLSQRLQFYSPIASGKEKDGSVYFENGFVFNLNEKSIVSSTGQVPRSVFFAEGEAMSLTEKAQPNANVGFSALVYTFEGVYKCLLLDRELANSLFVRLYCFRGKGLRHFIPFIDAEDGNNYIRVLNIIW